MIDSLFLNEMDKMAPTTLPQMFRTTTILDASSIMKVDVKQKSYQENMHHMYQEFKQSKSAVQMIQSNFHPTNILT